MDDLDYLLDDYDPFIEDLDSNTNNNDTTAQKSEHSSAQLLPANTESIYGKRDQEAMEDPVLPDIPTKKKKVFKKLDDKLLLESNGIYRLRSETPWLKFKGKGHEVEDLRKLMMYYKVWANQLFPKYNFTDFSEKVMKVTSKKQCRLILDQWRDEYKFKSSLNNEKDSDERVTGELSGMTLEDEENKTKANKSDNSSDEDNDDNRMDELEYFSKLIQKATPVESSNISPPVSPSIQAQNQQQQKDTNKESIMDDSDSDELMFIPSNRIKPIEKKQLSKTILNNNENIKSFSQRNNSSQTKIILDDSDDDDEIIHTSSQQKQINKILDDSDDDVHKDIEKYMSNETKQDTKKQEQNNDQSVSTENESKNNNDQDDEDDEPLFDNNNKTSVQSKPLTVDDFFSD